MRALSNVPVKEIRRKLSEDGDNLVRRVAAGSIVLVSIVASTRYAIGGADGIAFRYSLFSLILFFIAYVLSARRLTPAQTTGGFLMGAWILQLGVLELFGSALVGPMTVVAPLLAVVATLAIGNLAGWLAVATLMLVELAVVLFRPYLHETGSGGVASSVFVSTLLGFAIMFVTGFAAWIGWYYSKLNREMLELILHQATQDYLTHIPNRRTVDETFDRELRRASEQEHWLSFMLIDVDYFKRFNDGFGHQAGDDALVRVAEVLRDVAEDEGATPGRYGGEEFAVVLPKADFERATAIAETVRKRIMALDIASANPEGGPLTVSVGVCSVFAPLGTGLEEMALSADECLYESKADGRNRVKSRVIKDNVKRLPASFPASRNRPGAQLQSS